MEIKPQNSFPLIEEYKKVFKIDNNTIFAYNNCIYTNNILPEYLIIHEKTHLRQQNKIGLDKWVFNFLNNIEERLKYEIEAYQEELKSIKDKNERARVRIQSARNLSSELYGNIISFEGALNKLK